MTTKNCANGPKLVLKDLCEKSLVRNVMLSFLGMILQNAKKKSETLPSANSLCRTIMMSNQVM